MNLLENGVIDEGPYLRGWYPGYGEDWVLRKLPAPIREGLALAAEEYPPFVEGYLVPTLGEICAYEQITNDFLGAFDAVEYEELGLGSYEDFFDEPDGLAGMGNLGKSFLKKVGKAIKKVAKTVTKPMVKVAKVVKQKVEKPIVKGLERAGKWAGRVGKKYGNVIISAAGIVLAPFTGGASLVAAGLLTSANTLYQKKRAAAHAKQQGRRDAAAIQAQAQQQETALQGQVDGFYRDNQAWFQQRGITPEQWAGMTLQQKIDAINAGTSGGGAGGGAPAPGAVPVGFAPPQMPQMPPGGDYQGGGSAPGGGGGGGGFSMPGGGGGGPGAPQQAQQPQGTSQAGMFGGSALLPLLAIGGAIAVMSGGGRGKGRSRARRNPSRRSMRRRW